MDNWTFRWFEHLKKHCRASLGTFNVIYKVTFGLEIKKDIANQNGDFDYGTFQQLEEHNILALD
jgi:hypothetical protein